MTSLPFLVPVAMALVLLPCLIHGGRSRTGPGSFSGDASRKNLRNSHRSRFHNFDSNYKNRVGLFGTRLKSRGGPDPWDNTGLGMVSYVSKNDKTSKKNADSGLPKKKWGHLPFPKTVKINAETGLPMKIWLDRDWMATLHQRFPKTFKNNADSGLTKKMWALRDLMSNQYLPFPDLKPKSTASPSDSPVDEELSDLARWYQDWSNRMTYRMLSKRRNRH